MGTISTVEFKIFTLDTGKLRVYGPGHIPAGTIITNERSIQVSGPTWASAPPPRDLSQAEVDSWLNQLREKGFAIS
jgi:hypothetical protein